MDGWIWSMVVVVSVVAIFVAGIVTLNRWAESKMAAMIERGGVSQEGAKRAAAAIMFVLAAALVWYWWFGGSGKVEKAKTPATVAQAVASPAECACLSGAMCEGPRGGKYCVTETGEKVYRTKK